MKRKLFTRILAVILALAVVFVPTLSTVGTASEKSWSQDCPHIYIHGFMGTDIYKDPSNPSEGLVWPPSSDSILAAVKGCLGPLLKVIAFRNWDEFGDVLIPYVYDMFAPAMLGTDGKPVDKSGPEPSSNGNITKNSDLRFRYDWRIDPIEVASQLNDYIEYVCEKSGCDKVTIECHSYGGVITNTYAQIYGTGRLKSVCYNTTAIFGESYTGELLTGNIVLTEEALVTYLKMMLSENEYKNLINGLLDMLTDVGITEDLCDLGTDLVENLGVRASKEVLAPLFGGWLSIWSMIVDDTVPAAKNYVFNTLYKDDGKDYSGLIAKIDDYNTRVRPNKTELLKSINDTANVYVISRYTGCGLFLAPSWKTRTDSTVDTKYSSFGATTAPWKETLTEAQLAGKTKYISPDKTIDASTCLFPDQTWLVRGYPHANNCDDCDEMVKRLLYHNGQATIDTFEEYPQYLYYENDSISPDTLQGTEEVKFFDRLKLIFADIGKLIKLLFSNIFKK